MLRFLLLLAANDGFLRFRCSRMLNTLRCGSQKHAILANASAKFKHNWAF